MAFSTVIAHHILSNPATPTPTIAVRTEAFASGGMLDELIYDLKSQFIRKNNKFYGRFSSEKTEFPFSTWLKEYREERLGFISFTQKIVEQFQLQLEKVEEPIDAHLFFAMEKIEAGEFLYIFIVAHAEGLYLDHTLNPVKTRFLNSNDLGLSAKINLAEWEQGESATFLAIVRERGAKELSEAFSNTIGFSDKHDVKNDTLEFLKVVDSFSQTLDEDTAKITRAKIVDYCLEQNKAGKSVVIKDLSQNLSEDIKNYEPEHFARYLSNTQDHIKEEFIPDSSEMRSYARISGRSDSLSMSFDAECLGKDIVYDPATDSLTITHLPAALKTRLLKHLKGRSDT